MRKRIDALLVERGLFASRARAQAAIDAGLVSADGALVGKASALVEESARLAASEAHPYVSRGGVKLAAALDAFALSPEGRLCLDVGASTGGFTDVLLRRGAAAVIAVDVGTAQLAESLRGDVRVRALEQTDARALSVRDVGAPQALTFDVSFISLTKIFPNVLPLAAPGAWLVALVKPQFEAGRAALVKGRVREETALERAQDAVREAAEQLGWTTIGQIPSPIPGGDGAREFLYAARRGGPS
jgi:23S rRNA (cytidine1920-2'-O)/16S rRNA (cytidine1409-2'-O)-methyltransferase